LNIRLVPNGCCDGFRCDCCLRCFLPKRRIHVLWGKGELPDSGPYELLAESTSRWPTLAFLTR